MSKNAQLEQTTQLLARLVQSLVDNPDEVRIQALEGTQSTIFEVSVAPTDVRRVIGRRGRTADALRELMTSWGGKERRKLILEIMEPEHRMDELPGTSGLGLPVKVERRLSQGDSTRGLSVSHQD